MRDLVIVGSGPAGYTAAIYAARANLRPVLIASSVAPGGDLMNTTDVENFPGFPEGIQGPELSSRLQEQAERFGTEIIFDDVQAIDLNGPVKRVQTVDSGEFEATAVIYATGSAYRRLGLPDEQRLSGYGVSWCATCDGFFFTGKAVAVIGGGDSALEEALFLTRFASQVYLVHRRGILRASKIMQDRAFSNDKIEFVWNYEVTGITGEESVTGLSLRSTIDGSVKTLNVDGVFIAIGSDPRTRLVSGQLELASDGSIRTEGKSGRTNLRGVFAAGDVIDPTYRQAVTAAASGAVAALDAEHYLAEVVASAAVPTREKVEEEL